MLGLVVIGRRAATALDASDFYDTCFIRSYDAAHLAAHPGQRVSADPGGDHPELEADPSRAASPTQLTLRRELSASAATATTRSRAAISADALRQTTAARRTASRPSRSSGRTRTRSTSVNDTTGLTGEERRAAARDYLAAGGEHGAFALDPHRLCSLRGLTRAACTSPSDTFKENARRALADPQLQRALGQRPQQLHRQARASRRRAAGIRGAARAGAGDQGPHARPSRPLPRSLRGDA